MDVLISACVVTTTTSSTTAADAVTATRPSSSSPLLLTALHNHDGAVAIKASLADDSTVCPKVTSYEDGDDHELKLNESNVDVNVSVKQPTKDVVVKRNRRKQHRRGKKNRKWRPYNKLSLDEKRALENQEDLQAVRLRDERFAHGQPVAPYNTTQFLMEDHNVQEPDLDGGHHHSGQRREHRDSGDASTTVDDSDEYYYSSPDDEDEFLQKEFCEVYDNINFERLASMSKSQLIQEYMQLEERVDKLESKVQCGGSVLASSTISGNWDRTAETNEKVRIFRQEIRKLAEENERLRRENEQLEAAKQAQLSAKTTEDESQTVVHTNISAGSHEQRERKPSINVDNE